MLCHRKPSNCASSRACDRSKDEEQLQVRIAAAHVVEQRLEFARSRWAHLFRGNDDPMRP